MSEVDKSGVSRTGSIMSLVSRSLMDSSLNYEQSRALLEGAANGIEDLERDLLAAQERAERAETELDRRKGDPTTRLHNICEAIEEPQENSPYSKEAFELADSVNVEQQQKIKALNVELSSSRAREAMLRAALINLQRGYVNLLETGHDRIIAHGGECDPVDMMERNDCYLKDARAALSSTETKP